jgi:acetyltransferase-like isoleucine patch superfamily enzyme
MLKKIIQRTFRLRNDVGIGFYLANGFFKHILRQNVDVPWAVHHTSTILFADRIKRGKAVYPGDSPGNFIDARNGLEIGDFTNIGPNVGIITANHDLVDNSKFSANAPIRIGAFCWIGMGAVLLPAVELGDFTIVGAGAVVTAASNNETAGFKDGYIVIAGNPAKIIRRLDRAQCEAFSKTKHIE